MRVGDTISLHGRIEELRPLDGDLGLVRLGWRVLNQRRHLVLRARVDALWRRDPSRAEPQPPAESRKEPVYL